MPPESLKKKILIVDDSSLIHCIYGRQLESVGCEVVHASNGLEGIKKAFVEKPDLIICDIRMPKINGYQVCRMLKDREETRHIPIVIFTGDSSFGTVADPKKWSFETGADAFYDKNKGGNLLALIEPLLSKRTSGPAAGKKPKPMTEGEILTALSRLLDKQLYINITRLKELNERKDAFVANVSHEFCSPLAMIAANIANVADGILGPVNEKQKQSIEIAKRTVQRLVRLVNDMLDIARIEAGKLSLKRELVDLSALLDEVINVYEPLFQKKKVKILKECKNGLPSVYGDRDRLIQVIINLVTNCLKYSPENGTITFRLRREAAGLRLEIQDEGPGIARENLEKIFDKFERITEEKREGTGLGLPIARDIISLHGGKIWAESTASRGTTFVITLKKTRHNSRTH